MFIVGAFALADIVARKRKREERDQNRLTLAVPSVNGPSEKAKAFLSERIPLPRVTNFGALVVTCRAEHLLPGPQPSETVHSGIKPRTYTYNNMYA